MKRIALFICFLLLVLKPSAAENSLGTTVNYHRIMVGDVAAFSFRQVQQPADQTWVVAKVAPNVTDKTFDSSSGDTHGRGLFKVLAALTQAPSHTTLPYIWTFHPAYMNPADLFQNRDGVSSEAFLYGGTAICCLNAGRRGNEIFGPAYLIPSEWQSYVLPAFKFYKANRGLFETTAAPGSKTAFSPHHLLQLRKLLTGDNPFLASEACRTLSEKGNLDPITVTKALSQSQDMRQALRAYLVFKAMPQSDRSGLSDAVSAVIEAATNTSQIQGIALAVFTTKLDMPQYPLVQPVSNLLKQVDQKQASFHTDTPTDRYVTIILRNAGTRPQK